MLLIDYKILIGAWKIVKDCIADKDYFESFRDYKSEQIKITCGALQGPILVPLAQNIAYM